MLARSLNRVGNWHLNVEEPLEALRCHQEALAIFRQLNDPHGIAETLDLLGMASYLGGDLVQGTRYYEQAVTLFRQLDDRLGLTSSLASLTLRDAIERHQGDAREAEKKFDKLKHQEQEELIQFLKSL